MFGIQPAYSDAKPGEARETLNTDITASKILGWNPQRELSDYLTQILK
jgi:hypothetical protein